MPPLQRVLIIDDEEALRDSSRRSLIKDGLEVTTAADRPTALALINKWVFDLIILDLVLPGADGLELLQEIRESDPEAIVIVVSAYGTVESAVKAMKLGAHDFLSKPFTPSELRKVVRQALDKKRLALENIYLRQELEKRRHRPQIVSKSAAMAQVMEMVERVAPADSTVLITGESGTGKGLVARRLHELSERAGRPFVAVDCGTLVETLFESELFGHVKGAFTGAESTKLGKFELAQGGTIFFDEISNISLEVQAKLLRAVEDREISKVGSHRTFRLDVRILAATNQDLQAAISQARFREDLYYRLNVVSIHIPPLRERREDIPPLLDFFLKLFTSERQTKVRGFSPRARDLLLAYDWPGNVRELANTIERLVVLGQSRLIKPEDLAFVGWRTGVDSSGGGLSLQESEREHIRQVLQRFGGRRNETAEALGIDRKTLRAKMRKYNLE